MKKLFIFLLIALAIISGLYSAPSIIPSAHAAGLVGKVCLASTSATVCPATPPTIPGAQPLPGPTQFFLLRVLINSSDSLNGWDITLRTDHTVLNPTDVTIGTVNIGTATTIVKCIGGVNKLAPSSPCPLTDSVDTLHYAVSGSLTPSRPVTDLLFTANFTIIANSANTPITFQTGCTGVSVTGGVCVTITNGSTTPVPETYQTAKFTNQMYFDIVPSTGSLEVSKGDIDLTATVTIPSLNLFVGTVNLGVSSSPVGPTVSIIPNSVTIAPSSDGLAELNVTVTRTVAPGTYTLNITGTSGSLPPNWVTVQLTVPTPDFTLTPTPNNLFFNVTASGTSNVTISSVGNFNGTVTLSLPSALPQGLSALFLNPVLKLSSKGANMTKLIVNSTSAGIFNLNITATSGTLVHTTKVTITVLDFFLHVPQGVLTVLNGTKVTRVVEIDPTGFYNVTVTIGNKGMIFTEQIIQNGIIAPSTGVLVSCSPNILKLTSTGNTNGQNSTNCDVTGQAVGDYIVVVTATSGSAGHTSNHAISFQVAVIKPSYSIILPSTVTTVSVGSSTNVNVIILGNHGLADNVTINLSVSSTSLSLTQNATIARLTGASPNATILVTITASPNTPSGTYTLTVTGTGKFSNPPVITATTPFVVITTTSPQDLEVYSVTPSATSVTIGQDVTIAILVRNIGKLAENATVLAIVGDQNVGAKNVTLSPGQNTTVTITWHTSNYSPGAYMVGGKIPGVPGESILSNNLLRSATPVTLDASNTSIWSSPYTIPAIVIAAVILVVTGLALFFLPRRKTLSP